jgi:hypothetical protein
MSDMDDDLGLVAKLKVLAGTDALQLWRKGKEEWNSWVSDNQHALIDFSDANFRAHYAGVTSFEGYLFPKAGVSFLNVSFGELGANFRDAHFNGPVSFENIESHTSSMDFNNVVFEDDVTFMGAKFSKCVITFTKARFNGQDVSFQDFKALDSLITFNRAIFDCTDLTFSDAKFSGEVADFSAAQFCGDIIDFGGSEFQSSANFGGAIFNVKEVSFFEVVFEKEGYFQGAIFNCDLSFLNSKFQGNVDFRRAEFANYIYDFNRCLFKHHLDFSQVKGVSQAKTISFKNAIFESSFDISNIKLGCVVDLTGTKFTNQVSIAGLECSIQRVCSFLSKDKLDSERLRRLKDISKTNNDHIGALRFHADEMRAKRWHYGLAGKSFLETIGVSIIDTMYDWSSEYGQSISKPILWLLLLVSIFTTKYAALAQKAFEFSDVSNLAIFSLGNSLPFIPISKLAREAKIKGLFGGTPPELYDLMMLQGGLSFIFIFLIGLGLRNRFRI